MGQIDYKIILIIVVIIGLVAILNINTLTSLSVDSSAIEGKKIKELDNLLLNPDKQKLAEADKGLSALFIKLNEAKSEVDKEINPELKEDYFTIIAIQEELLNGIEELVAVLKMLDESDGLIPWEEYIDSFKTLSYSEKALQNALSSLSSVSLIAKVNLNNPDNQKLFIFDSPSEDSIQSLAKSVDKYHQKISKINEELTKHEYITIVFINELFNKIEPNNAEIKKIFFDIKKKTDGTPEDFLVSLRKFVLSNFSLAQKNSVLFAESLNIQNVEETINIKGGTAIDILIFVASVLESYDFSTSICFYDATHPIQAIEKRPEIYAPEKLVLGISYNQQPIDIFDVDCLYSSSAEKFDISAVKKCENKYISFKGICYSSKELKDMKKSLTRFWY